MKEMIVTVNASVFVEEEHGVVQIEWHAVKSMEYPSLRAFWCGFKKPK